MAQKLEGAVAVPYGFVGIDGAEKIGYVLAVKKSGQEVEVAEGMRPYAPGKGEILTEGVAGIVDADTKLFKIERAHGKVHSAGRGAREANMYERWVLEAKKRAMEGRDVAEMRRETDAAMKEYVAGVREKRTKSDLLSSTADEEGWTVVGKRRGGSNKKSTDGKGTSVKMAKMSVAKKALAEKESTEKLSKEQILREFYNFRAKESRKKELSKLQRRFQADREKVERMKQDRKFKV